MTPEAAAAFAGREGRFSPRAQRIVIGSVSVVAGLSLWQVLTATGRLDPGTFPTTLAIARAVLGLLVDGEFWSALGHTAESWALGLAIAIGLAIPAGIVIGNSKFLFASTRVIVDFLRPIPVVALLPLGLLMFGTTIKMKLLLVVFGAFWPLLVQVVYGARDVDPVVADTARAFRLGRLRRFGFVVLPSAAPFVATGLRLAATGAFVVTIIAELVAGGQGLGLMMFQSDNAMRYSDTYALVFITGVLGLALNFGLARMEHLVLRWHPSQRIGG